MTIERHLALAVGSVTLGLALACGSGSTKSPAGGDDGGTGSGSGSGSGGGANAAACDTYYEAVLGCFHPNVPLPAAEMARIKPRWEASCESEMSLPGSGTTTAWLDGCAAGIKSLGCDAVTQPGGPCVFTAGTLAAGASCHTGDQCLSDDCADTSTGQPTGCGVCSAPIAIGQPCPGGLGCSPPAVCDEPSGSSEQQCMAVVHGAEGTECDPAGAYQCTPGLICPTTVGTCTAPGGAGAPCSEDTDCAAPLGCPTQQGTSTCRSPGQAGATCADDTNCVVGLGCDSNALVCTTITWASAGQPCSGSVNCLVGECPFAGGTTGGTCPAVIADGQPCSQGTQCDAYAICTLGTCQLTNDAPCP